MESSFAWRYANARDGKFQFRLRQDTVTARPTSTAYGASCDGTVIVGMTRDPSGGANNGADSFRWTQNSGLVELGLGGVPTSYALSVSDDGSVIVGHLNGQAFKWTLGMGLTLLGGDTVSANAVSANGLYVVGWTSMNTGVIWNEAHGIASLGQLGTGDTIPVGVSDDGNTVVGVSATGVGGHFEQFIWRRDIGIKSFQDVLVTEYGLGGQLAGWSLDRDSNEPDSQVRGITPDGLKIIGYGINPSGISEAHLIDLTDVQAVPEASSTAIWLMLTALVVVRAAKRYRTSGNSR